MKIALIAERVGPLPAPATDAYPGDPADRVVALARALGGLGQKVTIYARRDDAGLPDRFALCPGVTIERISAGPASRLPADQLLGQLAPFGGLLADRWQRSAPVVVHAHFWTSGLAALVGARDLDLPVVQTFRSLADRSLAADLQGDHGPQRSDGRQPPGPPAPPARIRLETAIGRSARAVLASTSAEFAALVRRGVPQASVTVVPSGVDTTRFRPSGPVASRARRPRLLVVAPLDQQQGLVTVLQALTHLPEAELVIAGGPPQAQLPGDPGYQRLTRLAERLGLRGRLTCTGRVSQAGMPALLRSADVLVSVTAAEPFDLVPLEAMACGVPVIAAAGSQQDAVIDEVTGFLVPAMKPVVLASRVGQLLARPMLAEGYGIAAASRARDRYSWERIGKETLAAYERMLALRARAAA